MSYADSSKLTDCTATTYQYSRREVEEEILHHAVKVAEANWLSRGQHIQRLKHWVAELRGLATNHIDT